MKHDSNATGIAATMEHIPSGSERKLVSLAKATSDACDHARSRFCDPEDRLDHALLHELDRGIVALERQLLLWFPVSPTWGDTEWARLFEALSLGTDWLTCVEKRSGAFSPEVGDGIRELSLLHSELVANAFACWAALRDFEGRSSGSLRPDSGTLTA